MSHVIELHDSQVEVTITTENGPDGYNHDLIQAFDKVIRSWFANVPITILTFEETATAGVFDLHFEDAERSWDQKIDFRDNPADPLMTFAANPGWRLSEFEEHRDVIKTLLRLRNETAVITLKAEPTQE